VQSPSSASGATNPFFAAPQPASLGVLLPVNIRNHVPILLDLLESNYSLWRCLFDSVLGKFGLVGHVCSPPLIIDRDAEWQQVDYCITNWLYTTATKSVFDLVYKPEATAFTIWSDIEGIFLDNEMQRAVLEAEFRSVVQGDLSITDYCNKLKKLVDNLRDVGHPVSEPSQVLNLLRGLNKNFRHVKPVLTAKSHTFMSARSYLLLEELQLRQDDKTDVGQAFVAGHGNTSGAASPGASSGSGGSNTGTGAPSSDGSRNFKPKNRRRGRYGGGTSASGGNDGAGSAGGGGGRQPYTRSGPVGSQSLDWARSSVGDAISRTELWCFGPMSSLHGPTGYDGPSPHPFNTRQRVFYLRRRSDLGHQRPIRRVDQRQRRHQPSQLQQLVPRHRRIHAHVFQLRYTLLPYPFSVPILCYRWQWCAAPSHPQGRRHHPNLVFTSSPK
jgi:hypothetical protein